MQLFIIGTAQYHSIYTELKFQEHSLLLTAFSSYSLF